MAIDVEKIMEDALRDGIREGIKNKMEQSYSNPFNSLIEATLQKHEGGIRAMIGEALQACIGDAEFREEVRSAVRHTLAKTLVARFGGELEKQVNALKSDPTTRARITLAIEEIVKSKTA